MTLWAAILDALLPNVPGLVAAISSLITISIWHRVALKRAAIRAAHRVVDSVRPRARMPRDDRDEVDGFEVDGVTQVEQLLQHTVSGKLVTRHDRRVVAAKTIREVRASLRPKR